MNIESETPFVKIIFDGVVAVGTGREREKGPFFGVLARSTRRLSNRTNRLRRARADAAKAGKVDETPEETPYHVHMHVPTIFTRLEPATGSRPPDQILQLSPFHDKWYLWHPLRERLEFRIDGDGTPGPLKYPKGEPVTFSSPGGRYLHERGLSFRGIEHLPDMEEIWPGRGMLRKGLLSSEPGVDERVMTQVLVPRGTVVSAGVLERGKPRKVVFEPARKREEQEVLPNAAIVVNAKAIEIATYSLDSGERLDSIKFDTQHGGEIWVSNGDPSDVEIDMKELSKQILQRLTDREDWTPSREAQTVFGRELDATAARMMVEVYHHHHNHLHDLTRALHRTGEFDLDFELFYPLMDNEYLEQDDEGLPVPRHLNAGPEQGPQCYNCTCRTLDDLQFKSNLTEEVRRRS